MHARSVLAKKARYLLLMSAALPVALHAQDTDPKQAAPVSANSPDPTIAQQANGEIVVTATRQSQLISRVPISISAFSQQTMDIKGIKDFQDVARFTPGVRFNADNNSITIRGISAGGGGAGTTGIYIDDTPIQLRGLGFSSDDTLPAIFDLDRVEVLRGPQGTLFGAGSEGGTVRYITPQPSVTTFSTYDRAEVSTTAHGGINYEAGSAVGGPLIQDKLGIRISAYHRRDGGYIDHVDNQTGKIDDHNINYGDVTSVRGALSWKPVDGLTITPSVYFQTRSANAWNEFFAGLSDTSKGKFRTSSPEYRDSKDRYTLPSINARYDFGGVSLIGNSSYLRRRNRTGYDGTIYYLSYYQHDYVYPGPYTDNPQYPFLLSTGINPNLPDFLSTSQVVNTQTVYTNELRLQSNNTSRFSWVAGVFYQHTRQRSSETLFDETGDTFFPAVFGATEPEIFGYPNPAPGINYDKTSRSKDSQLAGYADANFEIIPGLKLTGGIRYAETKFSFNTIEEGNFAPEPSRSNGKTKEHPVTPKVGISYQIDPKNLVYATWAKGYRVGGANPPVNPVACANDLALLGLSGSPNTYKSDTVKSIELGTKNKLFDNKLQIAASIYQVKWYGIQQNVYLSSCGLQFIANLGQARSRGFDLQATVTPIEGLTIDTAIGYNQARLTQTVTLGEGVTSARKGDAIEGAPWTVTVGAQYEFPVAGRSYFMRGDVEYLSKLKVPTAGRDPLNESSYSPGDRAPSSRTNVSLRAGTVIGNANVSLFVDNLFDSAPHFSYGPIDSEAILYTETVQRPRVIGLTLTYRR